MNAASPVRLRHGSPASALPALALLALALLASALLAGCEAYGPNSEKDACLSCHEGIEQAHPAVEAGRCVVCHGGDASARTKENAHVPVPENWSVVRGSGLPPSADGFIRDFAPDQLDALDPAYVQFINPGDTRVLDNTCGSCHPDHAATMPNSIMSTNAGHYFPTLHLAGLQDDRLAHFGSYPAFDPDCDLSIEGTVCEIETLVPPGADEMQALFADGVPDEPELLDLAYKHYLSKNCNTCHQAGFSRNNSPGLYRSTGCSSCHMVYGKLGVYEGDDPMIPRGAPVHPQKHRLTTAIPVSQCASCHFQGGRIGLLYQGIREGGFSSSQTPENAAPINETLYGHAPGYYFTDEDTTNGFDETPPDAHFVAGMVCADCHVGTDVHGDGRIYSSAKQQVSIACEDCHGSVRQRARPSDDGSFYTAKGNKLSRLGEGSLGQVVLTGVMDGVERVVPQPADLLGPGGYGTAAMHAAMAPDGDGWSHTDSLTCDSCHNSYVQYCIGCHVSLDLRLSQTDYQTGQSTPGLTRGGRSTYTLDHMMLATAPNGRLQPVHPSQQLQMVVRGAESFGTGDGELLHGGLLDEGTDDERIVGTFRDANGFFANNGFAPLFQHTTTRRARGCDTCHRVDDSPEEAARVRGVYGFGTGEFMLEAHDGSFVDGLQFLDADGDPTTDWVHAGSGPAAEEVRDRALQVVLPGTP